MKGFTFIEFLLVIAIFSILTALTTVNLFRFQHKTQLSTIVESFITDVKEQQTKAMAGDTEGRVGTSTYGVNVSSTNYTLFHGTYSSTETTNFVVNLQGSIRAATTFPNAQIVFDVGTGEIVGYASNSASVTFIDNTTSEQKSILFNKYGVITGVN